jgi:16S rRNA (guanine966-N2)-methyltransferase
MRVIAGRLGGRRLVAPRGAATRPTSDRVREALFSMLEPLSGARVLDLYAGSGALAIEALSRGAARAVAVERSAGALGALRRNVTALGLEGECEVLPVAVERALRQLRDRAPFELILVDPPYARSADGSLARVLDQLLAPPPALAAEGRLVVEHGARDPPPRLAHAHLVRTRHYGDTAISLYQLLADLRPREVS